MMSTQDAINAECGEVIELGLSEEEKERVVRLHNERRAFVANGLEKRGDPGECNFDKCTYAEQVICNLLGNLPRLIGR